MVETAFSQPDTIQAFDREKSKDRIYDMGGGVDPAFAQELKEIKGYGFNLSPRIGFARVPDPTVQGSTVETSDLRAAYYDANTDKNLNPEETMVLLREGNVTFVMRRLIEEKTETKVPEKAPTRETVKGTFEPSTNSSTNAPLSASPIQLVSAVSSVEIPASSAPTTPPTPPSKPRTEQVEYMYNIAGILPKLVNVKIDGVSHSPTKEEERLMQSRILEMRKNKIPMNPLFAKG
jgi:hypothetical protein